MDMAQCCGALAKDHTSLRNQVLSRYPSFVQNLLNSPSKEVRLLANIVARDPHSTTCKNMKHLEELTQLSVWDYSGYRIKQQLPVREVPDNQKWRLGFINKLYNMREEKNLCAEDNLKITAWLDSLCNT